MVEDTIEDLQEAKCIEESEMEEVDFKPGNFGRIAAFYGIKYQTIGLFAKQLEDENFLKRKTRALLSVLSQAAEFDTLPIRDGDEPMLRRLASYCTYPVFEGEDEDFIHNQPHIKANILLQCHFNRKPLSVDLRID